MKYILVLNYTVSYCVIKFESFYVNKLHTCCVVFINTSLYLDICSLSTTDGNLVPSHIL